MANSSSAAEDIAGPLAGTRILEFAGMGPAPFCGMLLADMGADIITITPPTPRTESGRAPYPNEPYWRGRAWLPLNLKSTGAIEHVKPLLAAADVLTEGFRPGVMERLGLGPGVCLSINPRLVYGRMTGWGQEGPLAHAPGHDPNYLAIAGALSCMGYPDLPPVFPLNMIGDFAGGGAYLAIGVLAGLLRARQSGQGQVIDAAMVDGVASLMGYVYSQLSRGKWTERRRSNLVDGGSPYATTYETADRKYVVVAAAEPQFYRALLQVLELEGQSIPAREDRASWPVLHELFEDRFRSKTRETWITHPLAQEATISPVLELREAIEHPHNRARNLFTRWNGQTVPAPAPRFLGTPTRHAPDRDPIADVLAEWHIEPQTIESLLTSH